MMDVEKWYPTTRDRLTWLIRELHYGFRDEHGELIDTRDPKTARLWAAVGSVKVERIESQVRPRTFRQMWDL